RVELALAALDQRAEGLGLALSDTGGPPVEAHDARRDREHRRELHDAARSRRQLDDETVGVAAETEEVDQLRGFSSPGALLGDRRGIEEQRSPERRRAASLEREQHRLADGQLGKQRRGLEGAAQARTRAQVRWEARHVVAEELDLAPAGDVAPDRVQERRLAGAVGADESDDLAGHRVEL